jgi:hypothetical protein
VSRSVAENRLPKGGGFFYALMVALLPTGALDTIATMVNSPEP